MKDMRSLVAVIVLFAGFVALGVWAAWAALLSLIHHREQIRR